MFTHYNEVQEFIAQNGEYLNTFYQVHNTLKIITFLYFYFFY